MSEKVLVKFESNYADEFDVKGFRMFSKKEWNNIVKEIKESKAFPMNWSFGSNEEIEYETPNELLKKFEVVVISSDEVKILKKLFGDDYGFFPDFADL